MQFESKLNQDDWFIFNAHVTRKLTDEGKLSQAIKSFFIWLVFGLVIAGVARAFDWDGQSVFIGMFITLLLICPLGYWERKKQLRRCAPHEDGTYVAQRSISIDETGMMIVCPSSKEEYAWPAFLWLETTDKYLFLFVDTLNAVQIPFAHAGRTELLATVEKYSGKKADNAAQVAGSKATS